MAAKSFGTCILRKICIVYNVHYLKVERNICKDKMTKKLGQRFPNLKLFENDLPTASGQAKYWNAFKYLRGEEKGYLCGYLGIAKHKLPIFSNEGD